MKLLIDDKYKDVNIWSFVKCSILSQMLIMLILFTLMWGFTLLLILIE